MFFISLKIKEYILSAHHDKAQWWGTPVYRKLCSICLSGPFWTQRRDIIHGSPTSSLGYYNSFFIDLPAFALPPAVCSQHNSQKGHDNTWSKQCYSSLKPSTTFCSFFECKPITLHDLAPPRAPRPLFLPWSSSLTLSWPHPCAVTLPDQNLSLWRLLYLLKSQCQFSVRPFLTTVFKIVDTLPKHTHTTPYHSFLLYYSLAFTIVYLIRCRIYFFILLHPPDYKLHEDRSSFDCFCLWQVVIFFFLLDLILQHGDISSPTRDWTPCPPALGAHSLTPEPPVFTLTVLVSMALHSSGGPREWCILEKIRIM